jgi:hypothetical protein
MKAIGYRNAAMVREEGVLFKTGQILPRTSRAEGDSPQYISVEGICGSKIPYPRRYLTQICALIIMNDCIRQIISFSPPSLSMIFIAPTRSAPELVSRTSMHVCTFRTFIEQRAVIRFIMLKGPRASAIAVELKSVHEIELLNPAIVKK